MQATKRFCLLLLLTLGLAAPLRAEPETLLPAPAPVPAALTAIRFDPLSIETPPSAEAALLCDQSLGPAYQHARDDPMTRIRIATQDLNGDAQPELFCLPEGPELCTVEGQCAGGMILSRQPAGAWLPIFTFDGLAILVMEGTTGGWQDLATDRLAAEAADAPSRLIRTLWHWDGTGFQPGIYAELGPRE